MKLFYDKNDKDLIYYAQQGIRNGAGMTTRDVEKFDKHSELLKITDDPLTYVKEKLRKTNKEYHIGKIDFAISADFNEHVKHSSDTASSSNRRNIGYFSLQAFLGKLRLQGFLRERTDGRRITFDRYTIHRFLTYARALDPLSRCAV